MRTATKILGRAVAIAAVTAFAGCECQSTMGTPPPQTPSNVAPPVTTNNPPPPAPLPPSLRQKLAQHPDGGS